MDSPVKFLAKRLVKEFLEGDVQLVGEDDGETWVDVVLGASVKDFMTGCYEGRLTILEVPRATSLLPSRSSACRSIVAIL